MGLLKQLMRSCSFPFDSCSVNRASTFHIKNNEYRDFTVKVWDMEFDPVGNGVQVVSGLDHTVVGTCVGLS